MEYLISFLVLIIHTLTRREARWPSDRASDSGARGRDSILTLVAVLYP